MQFSVWGLWQGFEVGVVRVIGGGLGGADLGLRSGDFGVLALDLGISLN